MRDKTKIKLSQLIFIEYLQGITLFQEFSSLDNDAFGEMMNRVGLSASIFLDIFFASCWKHN